MVARSPEPETLSQRYHWCVAFPWPPSLDNVEAMSLARLAKIVAALALVAACDKLPPLSGPAPAAPSASAAAPATASPGTAPARPAQAQPAAPPASAALPPDALKIEGLRQDEIVTRFGAPASERDVAPAKVLGYRASGCEVAIYLYFDTGRNGFFALHYDVNGRPAPSRDGDRCLRQIAAAKRG